ncbi:hypothetical protein AB0469_20835 [Streptomyces sp. NPDC093801]|uniref:hypothetical protein n=1 Tax=Streptomyces sp. NPDC093801 TaxID=3155203 RepID=UPI00344E464C
MAEAVPVRCPACQRENNYVSPVFPCACGSPVTPPLDLTAAPLPLTHRTWQDSWVAVRCGSCGRESEWPHPEVGCGSCGTVVLVPVRQPGRPETGAEDTGARAGTGAGAEPGAGAGAPDGAGPGDGVRRDGPPAGRAPAGAGGGSAAAAATAARGPVPRPPFRPVTIRTARDAVAAAALYLRWLGFRDVRQPDGVPIPSAAVDLRAPGVVAQVDPTTAPAGLRAVECVWLNGLTASATAVYFALAGYTEEARGRADDLGIPLFVMDLTGMPQPVNDPADALVGRGA